MVHLCVVSSIPSYMTCQSISRMFAEFCPLKSCVFSVCVMTCQSISPPKLADFCPL